MSNSIENNKRIAKNTLLLYFRMFFMMIVSLYTSRIVLSTLGIEDFGIYNVVGGVVSMFSFLNGAMATSTQRYLTFELGKEGNVDQMRKVFNASIIIHALISIFILILAETVGMWFIYSYMTIPDSRMDAALWVYQFSILSMIVLVMSVPYNACIIAHERMKVFAYISVLEVILKLLIVYILVLGDIDKLKLYAVLIFCVQLLIRFIYSNYCRRHFKETLFQLALNKKLLKEMTGFAGWNLVGSISFLGVVQGLNILLNIFFGPAVNAARGIAVQVQGTISNFSTNFQTALNPQIIKSYANKDLGYMHQLIFKSAKYSFLLLFFVSLPLMIEMQQILGWWLKVVPEHTVSFTRLVLISTMIDCMANSLIISAQATGKIRMYQICVGGILLLIVPLSYICLLFISAPEIVFIVNILVSLCAQIVRLYLLKNLIILNMYDYFKEVILKIIGVMSLSVILPLFVYFFLDLSLLRFMLVGVSCVISTGLSIYFYGLENRERKYVMSVIRERVGHAK
ncbi:lipopolysaccharide biosynthesis protein [Bacteroides xylanisolvens]|jgi:hypothetical protein|uniref:Lipopolysaccharide biosynthesis protein n=1 Tax=Bacteroides xylanisolvens TaxID=371601 RepID=A0A415HXF3_9BACE|nr:lipopolysaccharide biosynthesis protein [Bacteroides xylanisolvens]MCA4531109.1 lipopolysaccharide biosynthesis protein [Bacteroides xylanisolvens]MCA4549113.1 lipopolysaccharide biosynthesis protein [Bacteroides xylanisolvens]MCA4562611.1 lipopolysaccharide biosynthesis protein [Bacteroides xylanisolvens]MCA4567697.1 lipopolysaccharide biosynthesis protein [Bacteroides xylanisolvens]MCA4598172.1 lipopolysaccharide biosynthesis protein [Bacteroides xylanisolvens]